MAEEIIDIRERISRVREAVYAKPDANVEMEDDQVTMAIPLEQIAALEKTARTPKILPADPVRTVSITDAEAYPAVKLNINNQQTNKLLLCVIGIQLLTNLILIWLIYSGQN